MRLLTPLVVLAVALLGASGALAQSYPSKSVRIIVPFSAGGAPDVIGRVLAQALTEQTGQSFVVENRPGAAAPTAWSAPTQWRKPTPTAPRCWSRRVRS